MPSFPPPSELTVAPSPVRGGRFTISLLIIREAAESYDFSPQESQRRPVRFVITMRSPSSVHSSVRESDQFSVAFSHTGQGQFRASLNGCLGGGGSSSRPNSSISSRPMTGIRVGVFQFRRSHYSLFRSQYVFPFFIVAHLPHAPSRLRGTWYAVTTSMRRPPPVSWISNTTPIARGGPLSRSGAPQRA